MAQSILRYPLQPPVTANQGDDDNQGATKAIDYLMLQRSRIKFEDNSSKYYGENLPGNKVERELNPRRCYLAMPQQLQTQYTPSYRQVNMGVMGVLGASALAGMGSDDFNTLAETIQGAAAGAVPEVALGAMAQAAGAMNQALGLAGNVDASSLLAIGKGKVFNPFQEQIFSNMNFRTHQFTFKFYSRSEQEARMVRMIVDYIKEGSLPIMGATGSLKSSGFGLDNNSQLQGQFSTISSNRFLEVPDKFDLKFIRLNADGSISDNSTDNEKSMHFNIFPSVCTGINVNYTPDGQYTSFKRVSGDMVQVPAIQLTVSFTETRIITQTDVGPVKDGRGGF